MKIVLCKCNARRLFAGGLLLTCLSSPVASHAAEACHTAATPLQSEMAAEANTLHYFEVWMNDGSILSYPTTDNPKLTPDKEDLILTTSKVELRLVLGTVKKFTLAEKEVITAIEKVKAEAEMERAGDVLNFSKCTPGQPVRIFDRSGRLVDVTPADEQGNCQVSIADLPKGVYIVTSGSVTCKILKK